MLDCVGSTDSLSILELIMCSLPLTHSYPGGVGTGDYTRQVTDQSIAPYGIDKPTSFLLKSRSHTEIKEIYKYNM